MAHGGDIIIPWGSGGWKGKNVARDAEPGFEDPAYDDSAWPTITLPIGGGNPDGSFCPIHSTYPPATNWPENTDYLLRYEFSSASSGFTLHFAVDNTATIYVDGTSYGSYDNEDPGTGSSCPERDDHEPQTGEIGGGTHVLAIRCADRGAETYFDCQLEVTVNAGFVVGRVMVGPGQGVA